MLIMVFTISIIDTPSAINTCFTTPDSYLYCSNWPNFVINIIWSNTFTTFCSFCCLLTHCLNNTNTYILQHINRPITPYGELNRLKCMKFTTQIGMFNINSTNNHQISSNTTEKQCKGLFWSTYLCALYI